MFLKVGYLIHRGTREGPRGYRAGNTTDVHCTMYIHCTLVTRVRFATATNDGTCMVVGIISGMPVLRHGLLKILLFSSPWLRAARVWMFMLRAGRVYMYIIL